MGYARYVSLVLVTFYSILTHMFFVVFMYPNVRDDAIMDNNTS